MPRDRLQNTTSCGLQHVSETYVRTAVNWSLLGPVLVDYSFLEFLFLFIFHFLNLSSKLCFQLALARGGWLFTEIADQRPSLTHWAVAQDAALPIAVFTRETFVETFDIRLCGLRTGIRYEWHRQGGAEGEMQRFTTLAHCTGIF